MNVPAKKPQPSPNHYACGKCFGTGFYCMGIHNGKPYSHTGFTCYPCGGAGWLLSKFPAKAPAVQSTAPAAPRPAAPLSLPFKSKADAKRQLQALIDSSDAAVRRTVLAIYAKQTAAEQASEATVEDNGVGFSGCDAELLSSFAKQLLERGTLSEKQMAYARKKARKYWNQLRTIIESGEARA